MGLHFGKIGSFEVAVVSPALLDVRIGICKVLDRPLHMSDETGFVTAGDGQLQRTISLAFLLNDVTARSLIYLQAGSSSSLGGRSSTHYLS